MSAHDHLSTRNPARSVAPRSDHAGSQNSGEDGGAGTGPTRGASLSAATLPDAPQVAPALASCDRPTPATGAALPPIHLTVIADASEWTWLPALLSAVGASALPERPCTFSLTIRSEPTVSEDSSLSERLATEPTGVAWQYRTTRDQLGSSRAVCPIDAPRARVTPPSVAAQALASSGHPPQTSDGWARTLSGLSLRALKRALGCGVLPFTTMGVSRRHRARLITAVDLAHFLHVCDLVDTGRLEAPAWYADVVRRR